MKIIHFRCEIRVNSRKIMFPIIYRPKKLYAAFSCKYLPIIQISKDIFSQVSKSRVRKKNIHIEKSDFEIRVLQPGWFELKHCTYQRKYYGRNAFWKTCVWRLTAQTVPKLISGGCLSLGYASRIISDLKPSLINIVLGHCKNRAVVYQCVIG